MQARVVGGRKKKTLNEELTVNVNFHSKYHPQNTFSLDGLEMEHPINQVLGEVLCPQVVALLRGS